MKVSFVLRRAGRALAAGAVTAVLAAGCSGGGRPEVAAKVEGIEIRSTDTEALIDAYLGRQKDPQQQDLPRQKVAKQVLGYQIKIAFTEALAKAHGVESPPQSYFDTAAGQVESTTYQAMGLRPEDFARELKAGRQSKALAQKLFPDVTVSDNAVREEFQRRAPEFERSWKATVELAQFPSEEPAGKVKERTKGGEPFKAAAEALGATRVDTVEVNPVVASLPPKVLDAIGALKPGEVSGAVTAGEVWLAARVERRQDLAKPTFDDVRPELTAALVEQEQARLFQQWFNKEYEKAKVKVAGHYGEWSSKAGAVL